MNDPEYQRQIIDIFINAIYVFDDKLAFTYNFHDGTETITLKEIEAAFGSDLSQVAPPKKQHPLWVLFFWSNYQLIQNRENLLQANSPKASRTQQAYALNDLRCWGSESGKPHLQPSKPREFAQQILPRLRSRKPHFAAANSETGVLNPVSSTKKTAPITGAVFLVKQSADSEPR